MAENEQAANADRSNRIKDEFSTKIGRLTKSRAYLDFCEEVYGYRTYLFNMMDQEQIDFILNSVPLSSQDTLLDLGCGTGSILQLLLSKTGCTGIGIDQLDRGIVERNGKSITYINGDIDRISEYSLSPTVTLSIDSLYFSHDLAGLIRQLSEFKHSRFYFFYSQYLFDEAEDKSSLQGANTQLAKALEKNGLLFRTMDYSENERSLYAASLKALKKNEAAFALEGNTDLFEQKLKEDTLGAELYNRGLASRYLYIIDEM